MIVTPANSVIEPQNAESQDAEKNIFAEPRADRTNNDPRNSGQRGGKQPRPNNQPRRDKHDVHGWVVLDKPIGMTSTHAVAIVKRLFQAKPAGPARTLAPLPPGGPPRALGGAPHTH